MPPSVMPVLPSPGSSNKAAAVRSIRNLTPFFWYACGTQGCADGVNSGIDGVDNLDGVPELADLVSVVGLERPGLLSKSLEFEEDGLAAGDESDTVRPACASGRCKLEAGYAKFSFDFFTSQSFNARLCSMARHALTERLYLEDRRSAAYRHAQLLLTLQPWLR